MVATEAWVRENHLGTHRSPVVLTSIELEEELSQRNSSLGSTVVSVFDDMLGIVLRYLSLTRFYVLREGNIHAWNIPVSFVSCVIDTGMSVRTVIMSRWAFKLRVGEWGRKVVSVAYRVLARISTNK